MFGLFGKKDGELVEIENETMDFADCRGLFLDGINGIYFKV